LQGIYKKIKCTRKWQGKMQKLKEIARISVIYTTYKSKTTLTSKNELINSIGLTKEVRKIWKWHFRRSRDYKFQNLPFSAFCHLTSAALSSPLRPWMNINIYVELILSWRELLKSCPKFQANVMILDFL
jgi:hypothetical protein